jgi:hypothetical protein
MAIVIPPKIVNRPKGFGRKPNNYFTLHSKENDIFSIKIDECEKTTIVGFKNRSDAIFIGKMIETNFIQTNEWPGSGKLFLPKSQVDTMQYVYVHKWDFEDLKVTCTSNILDMVSVDGIIDKDSAYSFSGHIYTFDAPMEFYKERFEELINT